MIAPRAGTLAAFRSRDFRLLWSGQTISFTGDAAFLVALGWRVTDLTGKAGTLGFVLALESLAMLTTLLLGGVLADRYSRQLLMIGSDLARALVTGVFLVVDLSGHLDPGGRARARRAVRRSPTVSSSRRSAGSCRSSSSADAALGELVDRHRAEGQRDRRAGARRGALRHHRPVDRLGARVGLVRRLGRRALRWRDRAASSAVPRGHRRELASGFRYVVSRAVDLDRASRPRR